MRGTIAPLRGRAATRARPTHPSSDPAVGLSRGALKDEPAAHCTNLASSPRSHHSTPPDFADPARTSLAVAPFLADHSHGRRASHLCRLGRGRRPQPSRSAERIMAGDMQSGLTGMNPTRSTRDSLVRPGKGAKPDLATIFATHARGTGRSADGSGATRGSRVTGHGSKISARSACSPQGGRVPGSRGDLRNPHTRTGRPADGNGATRRSGSRGRRVAGSRKQDRPEIRLFAPRRVRSRISR
jgi:hypothetical protein